MRRRQGIKETKITICRELNVYRELVSTISPNPVFFPTAAEWFTPKSSLVETNLRGNFMVLSLPGWSYKVNTLVNHNENIISYNLTIITRKEKVKVIIPGRNLKFRYTMLSIKTNQMW